MRSDEPIDPWNVGANVTDAVQVFIPAVANRLVGHPFVTAVYSFWLPFPVACFVTLMGRARPLGRLVLVMVTLKRVPVVPTTWFPNASAPGAPVQVTV
jgi:hypothetical protein